MKKMLSVREVAAAWGTTERRIAQMCAKGQIPGIQKEKGMWRIPVDAEKPSVSRKREKQYNTAVSGKPLPSAVGITSYKEITSECYYVDKTLFIRDLIDDHNKVYLFTRPRRFGKTLTMDMVRTFFENTPEDNSVYFRDKLIWECGPFYQREQGGYPVISLSFKDAHQSTWDDMYQHICLVLRNEYRRHGELLDSTRLSDGDKQYFGRVLNMETSKTECEMAIGELCFMLSRHYDSKVVIIIDEYDTPIQQGYMSGCYEQVIGFMRNLFSSCLKDNDQLHFGVLTGILRVAKESLFSGLNNLVVNTILDEKYASYFGFTEDEVEQMAAYYHQEEKMDEIREWYDGYRFGGTDIYNPWSVMNYFNNRCIPKPFWSRTSSNDVIGELLKGADEDTSNALIQLMQDKSVPAVIDTDIIYPEIGMRADAVFSFLLIAGYLKIDQVLQEVNDRQLCSLVIPNKEIKGVFQHEILENLNKLFPSPVVREMQMSLLNLDGDRLGKAIHQFLLQSASSIDVAQETFYHGVMLGLTIIMSGKYIARSNREAGDGRYDILLEPMTSALPGIILELKAQKGLTEDTLKDLAQTGLNQIRSKNYAAEFVDRKIRKVLLYGVAFSGKQVAAVSDEIEG